MSFSGAGPYLTCFSIPVPSLVPGAKIFPRSACCMNEDKVFAWKSESISDSIMSDSFAIPWTVSCQAPCPWSSPGKDTGVGCHFLLQGIFLIQGLNPGLLHCRKILYWLSYQGSPRTREEATQWVEGEQEEIHRGSNIRRVTGGLTELPALWSLLGISVTVGVELESHAGLWTVVAWCLKQPLPLIFLDPEVLWKIKFEF